MGRRIMWLLGAIVVCTACGDDGDPGWRIDGGASSADGGGSRRDGSAGGRDGSVTPTGHAVTGDPCSADTDCADPPRASCFTTLDGHGIVPDVVFPGGYCSRGCDQEMDSECGSGTCAQLGMSGGMISSTLTFCAKPCMTDADCRTGERYRCYVVFPGFPGICVPPS